VGDVLDSKSLREEFVNTAAGYATGLITKKLIIGTSKNPTLKLFGLGIQLAMTTLISKNYAAVKEVIAQLAGSLFTKMQEDFLLKNDQSENEQPG
jgi:predicted Kef-type K+ transport protein